MFRTGGHTTGINSGGRRKLHTTFDDGRELVEEYDLKTGELLVRKTRTKTVLGKDSDWQFLVGDAPNTVIQEAGGGFGMRESSTNPVFTRQDSQRAFIWRIRNLVHPKDVYSVTVDPEARCVTVRTSNKKYFKRFEIPELNLLGLPLEQDELTWTHANNTLVIQYGKPIEVLNAEAADAEERSKIRAEEGDVSGCKQQ